MTDHDDRYLPRLFDLPEDLRQKLRERADEPRAQGPRRWWCPACGVQVEPHTCFGDCGCGVHTVCETLPGDPEPLTDEEHARVTEYLQDVAVLRSAEWGEL